MYVEVISLNFGLDVITYSNVNQTFAGGSNVAIQTAPLSLPKRLPLAVWPWTYFD